MVSIVRTVPLPRRPLAAGDPVREWYEEVLGWATAPGPKGLQLLTGLRFDVLELPAEAGRAVLRRLDPGCPVALQGETMRLLVAAGSAEELPGLLDWLEWGALPLDLTAIGAGGRIDAPVPPGVPDPQEAAVWVRPPDPGCDVEPTLPALTALSAVGGGGGAPGLVRLVETAATQCHRIRLRRACAQPLAFS
ncbi:MULTISPECIES: SCO3374 family protein [unclassified Streptomyces]|uniref:SCO3374 family protein n=1 Tax=unclassified Streptomyces TaxID=2593676 RepID=UPI003644F64A